MAEFLVGEEMDEYAKRRNGEFAKDRRFERRVFGTKRMAIGTGGGAFPAPSFNLAFDDLGAGGVNTAADVGGVSATFTRATTATTIGSTGLVVSVASGVPRSYYDPTSLTYLGYLAEGAQTNLLLRSAEFDNASWSKTDVTPTADQVVSPDGTTNAEAFVEGTAGTSLTAQAVTATANVNYALTFWAKRNGATPIQWLRVFMVNGANAVTKYFDILNGAVGTTVLGGTGAFVSASITAYPNSWWRIQLVGSVGSAATAISSAFSSALADNNSTRVNNASYSIWGAQFENNVSFASSYIPTTTASVTRNADVLTYPTTTWLNANAGTILAQWQVPAKGGTMEILDISDGTANERIRMFVSGANCDFLVSDGGVPQCDITNAASAGVAYKLAGTYAVNDFAASLNGGTVGTDTSGTLPAVNIINVGSNTASANHLFGTIRRVAYFATRLSNAQLQQITA